MNFVRVGPFSDWNSFATALVDETDAMLVREQRLNPAAGEVDVTWTLPDGGEWGCRLDLELEARDSGARRFLRIPVQTLRDEPAAASLMHRLWRELLDEDRGSILSASEPQLGRWDDDGGARHQPEARP